MGSGSALDVVLHDYALYKSTFTLLYFTLHRTAIPPTRLADLLKNTTRF